MKINRHNSIAAFFFIHGILLCIALYLSIERNWSYLSWLIISMIVVYSIIMFLYYFISPLLKHFIDRYVEKRECPYLTSIECPYGDSKQCNYDKSSCHYLNEEVSHRGRNIIIGITAVVSFGLSVMGGLIINSEKEIETVFENFDVITLIRIFAPVSTSVLAAIIMAWILDIPARMVEYKNYFIRILSSSEYLKQMKEDDLAKLRSKITWLLHAKDVPNMPRRLIQMDEQICQMLRQPYYNEYMQTVKVSKSNKDKFFHKVVKIEFIAQNPYKGNRPIVMDIGMANSLQFENPGAIEEAKRLFKFKRFSICFDDDKEEYSLLSKLKIAVLKDEEPGLIYNGKIVPIPIDTIFEKGHPFKKEDLEIKKQKEISVDYESVIVNDYSLYVLLKDKIKVNIEYEVTVPSNDNTYTKRLRYPVKIFHLDYTLDNTITDFTLVGQLIGTLIDQNNVSTELFDDNKRICLRTHEFLLPKNGVVIVHCSNKK